MNDRHAGVGGSVWRPPSGFVVTVLIVVEVSNVSEVVGTHQGVSVHAAAMVVAMAAVAVGLRRGTVRPVSSPVLLFAAVFLVARALTVTIAADSTSAVTAVLATGHDVVFLYVVTLLLCSSRRYGESTAAAVAAVSLFAGLSVLQEYVPGNGNTFAGFSNVASEFELGAASVRHSGPMPDPNFWGQTLVLFAPLAMAVTAMSRSTRARLAWTTATIAVCVGVYLTQSRGGFVALAVATVVWFAAAGRRYARLLVLAPVIAGMLLLLPGVGSRLGTLTQLNVAAAEGGDGSLVGRIGAWRIGFAIFRDHPVLGVGAGNYADVEPDYEGDSGQTRAVTLAAHNLYLEIAAEGGLLGLSTWLLFFGSMVFVTLRALLLARNLGGDAVPTPARLLAAGFLAGLIGWAVAAMFLHLAYSRVLLVVAALGAGLDVEARRMSGTSVEVESPLLAGAR